MCRPSPPVLHCVDYTGNCQFSHMSIRNWYVEERRGPALRHGILAVPTLSGEHPPRVSNPWHCQSWLARTRPAPVIPGTANPEWLLPRNPGSANAEWRGPAPRQETLAVPTLAGEMRSWDGRAHGYWRAYHLSSFTNVPHCAVADLDHRPAVLFEESQPGFSRMLNQACATRRAVV